MRLRFIGILAVLAMFMAFAAAPVAADHGVPGGEGEADCPEGTVFLHNFNQSELEVGLELTEGVFVRAVTHDGGGEATSVTIENTTDENITIAVKGGSDQEGNFVTIAPGETSDPIMVTGNPTISNLSVCAGPELPPEDLAASLTIVKDADGNTTEVFGFNGFTLVGGGSTTMNFDTDDFTDGEVEVTVTETLTAAQVTALWELVNLSCDAEATISINPDGTTGTVTVTLMDGDNVTCTFFNEQGSVPFVNTPTLSLDKVVTSGDAALAFGFSLDGSAIAGLSANDAPRVISTAAGAHTIVEAAQSGWTLASVQCTDNATAAVLTTTSVTSGTTLTGVTVTVGANQDVTCTFTNSPQVVLAGNPTPSPAPVRSGTLASSVPNTAMEGASTDQMPAAILGLMALGSLAYVARRNMVASKHRS